MIFIEKRPISISYPKNFISIRAIFGRSKHDPGVLEKENWKRTVRGIERERVCGHFAY
jgi:hypothetical protein